MINPLPLYEGRAQALSILNQMPNKEELVNELMRLDPSKSKKYVEIFAKALKQWMLDGYSTEILFNNIKNNIVPLIINAENKRANIDVSKISDLSTLADALKKISIKITRSTIKKGIQGLTENTDFAVIFENNKVLGLMPFSWEASKILASSYVGGVEGKWCIAYQKTDEYWISIVLQEGQAPVYMIEKNVEEPNKYAFMYGHSDLDIWDSEDNRSRNNEEILTHLGISKEQNSEIWVRATETAEGNLEGFGESEREAVINLNADFEINWNSMGITGYASVEKYISENGGESYDDSENIFYASCEGELISGKEFFNTEKGLLIIKAISESFDGEHENIPDLINNSLILDYSSSDLSKTFSDCYLEAQDEEYENDDTYLNIGFLSTQLKEKGIKTIIILVSGTDHSFSEEPLISALNMLGRNDRSNSDFRDGGATFNFEGEEGEVSYESINTASFEDYLNEHPSLKQELEGEWVRNDEREASYGQQFMNYENTNKNYNVKLYEDIVPKKTKKAYKLFQVKKTHPNKIFPLFIGATVPTPMGEWVEAKSIPKKGFALRLGWHVGTLPIANHLKNKQGEYPEDRVWAEVEIPADVDWQLEADKTPSKGLQNQVPVGGYYRFPRPKHQGGEWLIAGAIKVNRILSNEEVKKLAGEEELLTEASDRSVSVIAFSFPKGISGLTNITDINQTNGLLSIFGRGVTNREGLVKLGNASTDHGVLERGINNPIRFYYGYSRDTQTVYISPKNRDGEVLKDNNILKSVLSEIFNKFKLSVALGKKLTFRD
jgi:hypothetical protein